MIAAALEIGLDEVTMTAVAHRLNVSIAALYRHVRDVHELRRLAAEAQLREIPLPGDTGQHWSELARGYIEALFDSFTAQTSLFSQYSAGTFSPLNEVAPIERYLAAMRKRGFEPADALALMRDLRAVALGSALVAASMRSVQSRSGPQGAVDAAFDAHGVENLPLLHSVESAYRRLVSHPGWRATADRLFAAVAAERGEALPAERVRKA